MNRPPKKLAPSRPVIRFEDGPREDSRFLVREERYEVLLQGRKFTSVMLVPEHEAEFLHGFLFTSGIIAEAGDVRSWRLCDEGRFHVYFTESVLMRGDPVAGNWTITSGCGGGKVLESTYEGIEPVMDDGCAVTPGQVMDMFARLDGESELHAATRCVHKAYFFGTDGFTFTCEDVGRHNTIDKTIGAVLLAGKSFSGTILTTGRLTSEMVLKCARAGIPVVVSRTAPSLLGVDIARRANITLIGLASRRGFTVFTGPERVIGAEPDQG